MNWVKDEVGAGGFGGQVFLNKIFLKRSFRIFYKKNLKEFGVIFDLNFYQIYFLIELIYYLSLND